MLYKHVLRAHTHSLYVFWSEGVKRVDGEVYSTAMLTQERKQIMVKCGLLVSIPLTFLLMGAVGPMCVSVFDGSPSLWR